MGVFCSGQQKKVLYINNILYKFKYLCINRMAGLLENQNQFRGFLDRKIASQPQQRHFPGC